LIRYLYQTLNNRLYEWKIEDKVFSLFPRSYVFFIKNKVTHIVTDGAANIKLAISKFSCAAHKLNYCVLDTFKEKKTLNDERDKNLIKQTNLYNSNVKALDKLIGKCRSIVGSFRHSAKLTEALKCYQIEMGVKQLKLVQDVKTRWSTTTDLLSSFVANHASI
jgi:hypothetical protein